MDTLEAHNVRLPLALALLKRRAKLSRRRPHEGLRAIVKRRSKLRLLSPHFRRAGRLCFMWAEHLRREAATNIDLHTALRLYRAILAGGSPKQRVQAREKLLLMLCQNEGHDTKSIRRLLHAGGFECRLAPAVLRYSRSAPPANIPAALQPPAGAAAAIDGALPAGMLGFVQKAFAPASPFWREHGYKVGVSPFFSYVHSLEGPPRCAFDRVLRLLRQRIVDAGFAAASEAKYAEWWAHRRPHGAGHQLHFDSDNEGTGGIRNPIVSSALYLTGGGVGGPTLVTNQRRVGPNSGLATRGWLVLPAVNRYLIFDGGLLHGVVPGRGLAEAEAGSSDCRRISLMVAFWPQIRQREATRAAAAMPFPYEMVGRRVPEPGCSWPALFDWPKEGDVSFRSQADLPVASSIHVPLRPIQPVWQPTNADKDLAREMPAYDEAFQGA